MRVALGVCVALISLAPLAASAQEPDDTPTYSGGGGGGRGSSVLSGKTLGSGMLVHAQVGWPGLSVSLLTALSDRMDLGAKFSLLGAYEGITAMPFTPGVKLQGVLRLMLLERGKLNFGLRVSPGLFFYSFRGWTEFGLTMPLDLVFGLALHPKVMVNFGLDVPMFLVFGPYGGLAIPVLLGGGLEYSLDQQLGITFNLRAGPSVPLTGNYYYSGWDVYWCVDARGRPYRCGGYGYYSVPAVEMLIGITYRL